jgi:hypothetical protein
MPKFTLIAEHLGENDLDITSRVIHEFNEDYLHDVVMMMQEFLRGVGFYFDGELQILENEKPTKVSDDGCQHHECFWDTDRNL